MIGADVSDHVANTGTSLGSRIIKILAYTTVAALVLHGSYFLLEHLEERSFVRSNLVAPGSDPEQVLMASLSTAFQLPPHQGVGLSYGIRHPVMKILRPSAAMIHQKGGHCAKRSRLLAVLLREKGVEARKLYLYNERGLVVLKKPPRAWVHVVVEARIDDRWIVVDPLFNVVFRREDGELATAAELRDSSALVQAGRRAADETFDRWEESLYDYQKVSRFPWFMIPFAGDWLYRTSAGLFPDRVLSGLGTPFILELPQLSIACLSYGLAAIILLALWAHSRMRRLRPA